MFHSIANRLFQSHRRPKIASGLIALVLAATLTAISAQELPDPAPGIVSNGKSAPWDKPTATFITDSAVDGRNRLWIASEDNGVLVHDYQDGSIEHFTTENGLPENAVTAIAIDQMGRIWVGLQSRGLAVYNGKSWQHYEVCAGMTSDKSLAGPLGEHIFDIAVAPLSGQVWIGTNLGIARYSPDNDQWSFITRANGIPSDQVCTLAIDENDTVYAGTACDGLAIAGAQDNYATWQIITGPLRPKATPGGQGISSVLINDILIDRNNTLWLATDSGLSFSRDGGKSWQYIRGHDWSAKATVTTGQKPEIPETPTPELLEDYTTCLAEDLNGSIWVGHRDSPWELLDPQTLARMSQGIRYSGAPDPYLKTLCPMLSGQCVAGSYGGSMQVLGSNVDPGAQAIDQPVGGSIVAVDVAENVPFPSAAEPLPQQQRDQLLNQLADASQPALQPGEGLFVRDDWTTKGDWMGRYGVEAAVLCAVESPFNGSYIWAIGYDIRGMIGPNTAGKSDGLRHWIQWLESDKPDVLWYPPKGIRREAEWNDHGGAYPRTLDGPDIWTEVAVPKGTFLLSLYFFNKDGHDGSNRFRDFTVELHPWEQHLAAADAKPPLAVARVNDFYAGNYKVFAVAGPGKFLVKVARNHSQDSMVSAVMIDRLAGPPAQNEGMPLPYVGSVQLRPGYGPNAINSPWKHLITDNDQLALRHNLINLQYNRIMAIRSNDNQPLVDALKWYSGYQNSAQRANYMALLHKGFLQMERINHPDNPELKNLPPDE